MGSKMVCSVPLHRAHNERHTDARCTGRLGLIRPRSLPPAGCRMAGRRGAIGVQRTVQRVEERRPSRRQLANTPRLQGDGPCCGARVCRWPNASVTGMRPTRQLSEGEPSNTGQRLGLCSMMVKVTLYRRLPRAAGRRCARRQPEPLVNGRFPHCSYGVISWPRKQCGWPTSWGSSPAPRYTMLSELGVPSNPARRRMRNAMA